LSSFLIQHPTHFPWPTSSITLSIQLKGETASWDRFSQKAVNTHTPHPLCLIIIATLKKIVTIGITRNKIPYSAEF
jgi:hypothetical protein